MCLSSAPSPSITQTTPTPPRVPQATPDVQDPGVTAARADERKRRIAAGNQTLVNGAMGDTSSVSGLQKSLYGQ